MNDCEFCIYEFLGHSNGEWIHKTCNDLTRCPFYKPKEEKSGKEQEDEQWGHDAKGTV